MDTAGVIDVNPPINNDGDVPINVEKGGAALLALSR